MNVLLCVCISEVSINFGRFQANDLAQVPISAVHRRGAVRMDGTDPLLLYAYGAYGSSEDASFDSDRLSLLDR